MNHPPEFSLESWREARYVAIFGREQMDSATLAKLSAEQRFDLASNMFGASQALRDWRLDPQEAGRFVRQYCHAWWRVYRADQSGISEFKFFGESDQAAHVVALQHIIRISFGHEDEPEIVSALTRLAEYVRALPDRGSDRIIVLELARRHALAYNWLAVAALAREALDCDARCLLGQHLLYAAILYFGREQMDPAALAKLSAEQRFDLASSMFRASQALRDWRLDPQEAGRFVRQYCHAWWRVYRADQSDIGEFKFFGESDQAAHVVALQHMIRISFGYEDEPEVVSALTRLAEYVRALPDRGSDRIIVLELARRHALTDNWQAVAVLAREALNCDARCLLGQHLLYAAAIKRRSEALNGTDGIPPAFFRNLRGHFCHVPFSEAVINPGGNVHQCCGLLVPVRAGNIYEDRSWEEIWNSPAAQEIRASIHDGSFRYCSRVHCHKMNNNTLPLSSTVREPTHRKFIAEATTRLATPPRIADIGHDESCNLSCPQCRTELLIAKGANRDRLELALDRVILPLLDNGLSEITVTNGGDPFASRHYRKLLRSIDRERHRALRRLNLVTNGELFDERAWNALGNLHHLDIKVAVSIDAAIADTYARLRRRGNFQRLLQNLDFVSGLRAEQKIKTFEIRFVVQAENFREMPAFVRLGQHLGVDIVIFTKLANVGTYSAADFQARAVCDEAHPQHRELVDTLSEPIFGWDRINFTNTEPIYLKAVKSDHLGDARNGIRSGARKPCF